MPVRDLSVHNTLIKLAQISNWIFTIAVNGMIW